jgi:hypothetical protein
VDDVNEMADDTPVMGGGSSMGGDQGSFNNDNEDLARLNEILDKIQIILSRLVQARHILFRESVREHINSAWEDLESENGIFGVRGRARITRTVLLEPALVRNAGLSGADLSVKYQGIWNPMSISIKREASIV